ncbi:MAG: hypothetical protein ACE5F9_14970 [Phycisphaerae bacterium]
MQRTLSAIGLSVLVAAFSAGCVSPAAGPGTSAADVDALFFVKGVT